MNEAISNTSDLEDSEEIDFEDVVESFTNRSRLTSKQREALPKMLMNCSVILRIISSDEDVDVEEYELLCKETNLMMIDHFQFMNIFPTVHSVLAHSANLIRKNDSKGLKSMSEEGSESSHKRVRHLREFRARKMSVLLNLKDTFRSMYFLSDPIIRSFRRVISCSNCGEDFHTVRSCPELKEGEKTEDDILFENLTYKEPKVSDESDEEYEDLETIDEEEETEISHDK